MTCLRKARNHTLTWQAQLSQRRKKKRYAIYTCDNMLPGPLHLIHQCVLVSCCYHCCYYCCFHCWYHCSWFFILQHCTQWTRHRGIALHIELRQLVAYNSYCGFTYVWSFFCQVKGGPFGTSKFGTAFKICCCLRNGRGLLTIPIVALYTFEAVFG
jgi:hypothetical protein